MDQNTRDVSDVMKEEAARLGPQTAGALFATVDTGGGTRVSLNGPTVYACYLCMVLVAQVIKKVNEDFAPKAVVKKAKKKWFGKDGKK